LNSEWPTENGHRLIFHDFVPHAELLKQIATYDLGLAIEQYEPDSRNTTITNKILQYLQAGISVLATDTGGQKEVAGYFPLAVFLVPGNDPKAWAQQIERAAKREIGINKNKQQEVYGQLFSWPVQEQKLKQLISEHL
jgi:glycosyltransferase involved in cell wall biosynthesis